MEQISIGTLQMERLEEERVDLLQCTQDLDGPVENALRSDTNSVNLATTHVLRIDARRDEMDVHERKSL